MAGVAMVTMSWRPVGTAGIDSRRHHGDPASASTVSNHFRTDTGMLLFGIVTQTNSGRGGEGGVACALGGGGAVGG